MKKLLLISIKKVRIILVIVLLVSSIQQYAQEFIPQIPSKLILFCKDGCGAEDSDGKVIIEKKYSSIKYIDFGMYAAQNASKTLTLFNENGKIINEIDSCEYYSYFIENMLKFKVNGKYGYINSSGKIITNPTYERADNFSEGLARVQLSENGKCGYIDSLGKEVIPFIYDGSASVSEGGRFSEGLAFVRLNGLIGFIDKLGKVVIPCKYAQAGNFSDGLAPVETNIKGWGYIDKTGNEVIPLKYDYAKTFSEGFAVVCLSNGDTFKYGFIDKTGKEITLINYDFANDFSEGLALVNIGGKQKRNNVLQYKKSGLWSYIDSLGREIIVLNDTQIDYTPGNFINGKAKVYSKEVGYYFIDKTGNQIK